jgi:hypothetical protein
MDYLKFLAYHEARKAVLTVCAIRVRQEPTMALKCYLDRHRTFLVPFLVLPHVSIYYSVTQNEPFGGIPLLLSKKKQLIPALQQLVVSLQDEE